MSRRTAETIAGVMLATALGLLAALALVHWIELEGLTGPAPAAADSGTAKAAALGLAWPQRMVAKLLGAIWRQVDIAHQRRQIAWLESDIERLQHELAFGPANLRFLRGELERQRVVLALTEAGLEVLPRLSSSHIMRPMAQDGGDA